MNTITYTELSSLTCDLGVSAKVLYTLSNNVTKHYRRVRIPKSDSNFRELCVPDDFLKSVQRKIVNEILAYIPVSPCATAYRYSMSPIFNAKVHIGKPLILKLDIKNFFDSISYSLVKEKVFISQTFSEANRILLSMLCTYKEGVPQGAPTSPYISNIVMKDFDCEIAEFCKEKSIYYTRYCDDMTFSGDFEPLEVIEIVKTKLRQNGFVLNNKKTCILKDGMRKSVTGIVVNQKLNIKAEYRKQIRQQVYYCKKYGISEHIKYNGLNIDEEKFLEKLLGKINYVLSVDKGNKEMQEYKRWITEQRKLFK